jgi:two-component system, NtrC family, sensor kinase
VSAETPPRSSRAVRTFDGDVLRFAAGYGTSPELKKYFDAHPVPLGPGSASGLAASERRTIQIDDILAVPSYQFGEAANLEGWRTVMAVPMLKDSALLGTITIWRTKVQPFTDRQIALVETFADQAVIAIENVRLFNETKEALDQQTATSEILRVISRSLTDIRPVLDTVAASAARLCDALDATIFQIDGERLRVAVHTGPIASHPVGQGPSLTWGTPSGRAVLDQRTIHVPTRRLKSMNILRAAKPHGGWASARFSPSR